MMVKHTEKKDIANNYRQILTNVEEYVAVPLYYCILTQVGNIH